MNRDSARQIVHGFRTTSLGTLASRLLGLVRDIVTASLLGLGEGGVMDALVVALRLPNFSRRVFGEGALAASLLPAFTAEHERSPGNAWRLLSVVLALLTVVLAAVVIVGEVICLAWWRMAGNGDTYSPLIGLTAVLLPYMIFICIAAQLAISLQGLIQFRWPAVAPALLNLSWLAAAWLIAPHWAGDQIAQAYVLATAVLLSGVLQMAVLLVPLYLTGFRFEFDWHATAPAVRQVLRAMPPIAFGLAVTQMNTLIDSLLAVALAAPGGSRTIAWLGDMVDYPFETGAAAAIYYGERFYQLPVGVLGVAIATVIYPALARHAARGDRRQIGDDLTVGLRLVWFTALPAGVGLILIAEPIMRLLFVRGAFTEQDAHRSAMMIACYASAAWAYCALPVLVRGFYALGKHSTTVRVGMLAVGIDLVVTLVLIWPLAERGLALSTALAASIQVVLLLVLFSRAGSPLAWRDLNSTLIRGALATVAMALAVGFWQRSSPMLATSTFAQSVNLVVALFLGISVYLAVAWLLGMQELSLFWEPKRQATVRTSRAPIAKTQRTA